MASNTVHVYSSEDGWIVQKAGKATTTVTFKRPGNYLLEAVANDISGVGGGGFQCRWTTAQVIVTAR